MKKFSFVISWHYFVLIMSLFVSLMNFKLFGYLYANLEITQNLLLSLSLPVVFFALVCAIFSLLFVPYLTKFLAITIILVLCFSVYFMSSYGVIIDSDMLRNAARTDLKETWDLISLKFILFVLFLGILPSLLILKCQIIYFDFKKHIKIKALLFISSSLIAFGLLFIGSKAFIPFFRSNPQARVYNAPFYQFYSLAKFLKKEFTPKAQFQILSQDAFLQQNGKKKLFILVLGETARAANYSLGSYTNNPVNEYLTHEDVVFFDNFYSCGTATAISVPCMFSFSKRREYSGQEFRENVLDVLEKLGVNVVWLDNNSGGCQGVCNRLKRVENFREDYDGVLLDAFMKDLPNLKDNNLYILHLQGSHGPAYYKRYPKEFERFKPTCKTNALEKCTKEEIMNTYDNTLFYTDYIVEELIDIAKEQKEFQTMVFYVSDHGESLGENGIYLHGMPYAFAPKEQIHIPAILYHNDKEQNDKFKRIKNYKLSHDNLSDSLLGFFGVQTKLYEPPYDLFNPQLKQNP